MKVILAGLALGIATLAYASTHPRPAHSSLPIPLCPPDNPGCGAN